MPNQLPNPFREITAREVIGIYLILSITVGTVLGELRRYLPLPDVKDPIWTSITYSLLMWPLCGWFIWRLHSLGAKVALLTGKLPQRMGWLRLLGLTIATLVTSLGAFMLFAYLWYVISPDSIQQLVNGMSNLKASLQPSDSAWPNLTRVLTFITLIIVAPLTEEFIFRGILLQRWATKWNCAIALLLSSLLFGILHLNFIGAGILGLVAGVLYYKTKSLWAPVALHAINNTIASLGLVVPVRSVTEAGSSQNVEVIFQQGWFGLIGLALAMPWIIKFLRQNFPRKDRPIPYESNRIAAVFPTDSV